VWVAREAEVGRHDGIGRGEQYDRAAAVEGLGVRNQPLQLALDARRVHAAVLDAGREDLGCVGDSVDLLFSVGGGRGRVGRSQLWA
jgi:hypothetical protein